MRDKDRTLDRRVQRTRALLQEALFQLISKQGYEHISVADITEQANLGRTTFYLHYHDKEELLKESIQALLNELHLEVELKAGEPCTYKSIGIRIFQHIEQRRQLYRAMLQEAGPTRALEDGMRAYFTDLCQRFLPQMPVRSATIKSEILAVHAAGSLFSLLSWWLNQEKGYSAAEMGKVYCQLMGQEDLARA